MLFSEAIEDAWHYVHESATNGSHLPTVYNRVQRRVEKKEVVVYSQASYKEIRFKERERNKKERT